MKEQKGITLIALIITIIVMLILVAVTINVALNGGLFTKAKDATLKTEIAQIQEQLLIAKAEKIAENNGEEANNYNLTLSSLNIPDSLKTKYQEKLIISSDGTLHYVESAVTNVEKAYFQEIGISKQTQEPDPTPLGDSITFKDLSLLDWENDEVLSQMIFSVDPNEGKTPYYFLSFSDGSYIWVANSERIYYVPSNLTGGVYLYSSGWLFGNPEQPNTMITSDAPTFVQGVTVLDTLSEDIIEEYADAYTNPTRLTTEQMNKIINIPFGE